MSHRSCPALRGPLSHCYGRAGMDRKTAFMAADTGRTASAASVVFEALRQAIIAGEIAAGAPLRQDEIARMFNTSRIPVREALTRLEQHGLVQTVRFKGAVVAGLSAAEAAEIFDFRCLVEGEVIFRAVPRMTPAIIAAARAQCAGFRASPQPATWGDRNRTFHATLYAASGMPYHLNAIETAMDQIDRYLRARLLSGKDFDRSGDEHGAILDACERGDAEEARRLTVAHISGARESLLRLLA